MSLILIRSTPTDARVRQDFPGLSPAAAQREAKRLRAVINRWKYHDWTIRDDDGSAIATIDLRTLVGVECDTVAEATTRICSKSAAANDHQESL